MLTRQLPDGSDALWLDGPDPSACLLVYQSSQYLHLLCASRLLLIRENGGKRLFQAHGL
jgi:hypothetical protein